jgi:hypothetical protein
MPHGTCAERTKKKLTKGDAATEKAKEFMEDSAWRMYIDQEKSYPERAYADDREATIVEWWLSRIGRIRYLSIDVECYCIGRGGKVGRKKEGKSGKGWPLYDGIERRYDWLQ